MYRETTFLANKFGLSPAVGFSRMPAMATSTAGIPGVYERDRDASELCLVGNKPSEFVKGPLAEPFALLFSNRCPESLEVFKDYTSPGVFGSLNDFLGNGVVGGAFEPSLLSGELLEVSLGGLSSFLLEGFLKGVDSDTDIIDSLPGERCSVRGGCEVDDTKVYAERSLGREGRFIGDFDAKTEIENTLDVEKVGLSPDPTLVELGIGTEDDGYPEPSVETQDGDGIEPLEGENALVVNNGGVLFENMETLLLGPIGLGDLAYSTDGELGGETVSHADVGVAETVKPNLAELLLLKGYLRNIIASLVKNLNGFHEGGFLLSGREEFYLNC